MELSDLRVFMAVAQTGGVTRAADRLHRVPSNVSIRLKALEQELGAALFLREGRRMQLSPQGRVLLDYAERLLALSEEARDALNDTAPRGVLRLGSMESTAAVRLPGPICAFHERYPEVALELDIGNPAQLTARVLAGELDAALVAEPVTDPGVDKLLVYREEMVIVAQAGHAKITAPRDVAKRTLLVFHPGCPYRKRLEDWFARGRVRPERLVEVASYHTILGCTVAGMGVALMPRGVLDTYTERGRLSVHPTSARFRPLQVLLIWRKGVPQAKVAALASILVPETVPPAPNGTAKRRR